MVDFLIPDAIFTRQEGNGYDKLIDTTITISLPNDFIVDRMRLSWNGVESQYFNAHGQLLLLIPLLGKPGQVPRFSKERKSSI